MPQIQDEFNAIRSAQRRKIALPAAFFRPSASGLMLPDSG